MKEKKNLTFEPTIFRDWSIAYCELAYNAATKEFQKRFGWQYSDFVFLWDKKKETVYRAREEHIDGMFQFITEEIEKDKRFIPKITKELLHGIKMYEQNLQEWLEKDLEKEEEKELISILKKLKEKYLPLLPLFLIIMYFPQQIESTYQKAQKKYAEEFNTCVTTRAKVDKILAPLTEKLLRRIGKQVVARSSIKGEEEAGRFLTLKEIERLFEKKYSEKEIAQIKEEVKKRKKYFLFAGGAIKDTSLEEYLTAKGWALQKKKREQKKFLQGNAASVSKNKIIGIARIVHNSRELSKVKKNDIIIAPMTTPEYAPIFKKVSAIITDEGGITCHAAITAREWNIPTIIGTKTASTFFKDGEYIELDMQKGIVKKIAKKRMT